jgi:Ca2+-binding EF-hand superfamily protein
MDSIEKIIKQVDENGDGEISFEEFVAMMKKIE